VSTLSCQHRPSVALKTFTALSIRPWIRLSPAAFHWVWQFYRYYRRCLSWTSKMSPDVVIQRVQLGWIYRPYFFCSEIRAAVSQPVVRAIVGHWCCGHARFWARENPLGDNPVMLIISKPWTPVCAYNIGVGDGGAAGFRSGCGSIFPPPRFWASKIPIKRPSPLHNH